ncbi:MAG: hypothetical protein IKH42_03245 [Lachnospiraceae bacterium]|nr:hypothetical protein [Lachnospiraceae bacterium]MBR3581035.1 hypothetical protein [Lachnospiraceae bacterium]MBR4541432.1 hypothetical protein [Lachnospiraceae bacterium]
MQNLHKDYLKLEKELSKLNTRLSGLRKGNLRKRSIKGKEYFYLQYREDGHVRSDYVHFDSVEKVRLEIEERHECELAARQIKHRLEQYALLLGIHRNYRPVKKVDYENYTLFMSKVAHDYKILQRDLFFDKYRTTKYRGLEKKYLLGFFDYTNGINRTSLRRTNDLILDPYTYLMYFKYGQKEVLDEELKKAIPAFLNRGLLVTIVQEAVNGTHDQ